MNNGELIVRGPVKFTALVDQLQQHKSEAIRELERPRESHAHGVATTETPHESSAEVVEVTLVSQSLSPTMMGEAAALPENQAPVFIDFETRSACDIDHGGRRYAQHPTTEVISLVAKIDQRLLVWMPGLELEGEKTIGRELSVPEASVTLFSNSTVPDELVAAIQAGRPLCAHNALGFDAFIWKAEACRSRRGGLIHCH